MALIKIEFNLIKAIHLKIISLFFSYNSKSYIEIIFDRRN